MNSKNIFLYHKTNQRKVYNQERKKALAEGFFDVFFLNGEGQVTEASIANLFIKKRNKMFTPCLSSGLLPGVFRGNLLKLKKAEEKVLYLKDILDADKVYIGNSVRELLEVEVRA